MRKRRTCWKLNISHRKKTEGLEDKLDENSKTKQRKKKSLNDKSKKSNNRIKGVPEREREDIQEQREVKRYKYHEKAIIKLHST